MLENHTIAIVIPAFNEEAKIGHVIESMPDFVDHVLVVDDGSSDNTVEIAQKHGAKTISHKKNSGVGAAFNTGVKTILNMDDVDIMVNIDADGQFNPADIIKIVTPIIEKRPILSQPPDLLTKSITPICRKSSFGVTNLCRVLSAN
jgi:glycosyltransferase involved in cell wall biosynthesis